MSDTGEYISREAAIESMYKDAEAHQDHTFWTSQHEALLNIPAADVRPVVRGKWIWDDEGYHCSECFYHAYGETWEVLSGHWHFCPNCGAWMEES